MVLGSITGLRVQGQDHGPRLFHNQLFCDQWKPAREREAFCGVPASSGGRVFGTGENVGAMTVQGRRPHASKVMRERARARDTALLPAIMALQQQGITSARGLARALND